MDSLSATDAARNFSDVLNRVAYRQETLEINRGGRAVARLVPAAPAEGVRASSLNGLLLSLPSLDDDTGAFANDVRAAGVAEGESDPWA